MLTSIGNDDRKKSNYATPHSNEIKQRVGDGIEGEWGVGQNPGNHHLFTSTFCTSYFIAFLSSPLPKVTFPKVWTTKTFGKPKI